MSLKEMDDLNDEQVGRWDDIDRRMNLLMAKSMLHMTAGKTPAQSMRYAADVAEVTESLQAALALAEAMGIDEGITFYEDALTEAEETAGTWS